MKLTPLQRRAERKARNQTGLDMNLVSLIDVFTILIFFLLAHSGVETLPSPKGVLLPESVAETQPKPQVVVAVSASEILIDGRKVASVPEALNSSTDVIAPLKAELDRLRGDNKQLTIMGDKDIPYRLLRKVMVTGAQAQFSDVSFAVRQRETS